MSLGRDRGRPHRPSFSGNPSGEGRTARECADRPTSLHTSGCGGVRGRQTQIGSGGEEGTVAGDQHQFRTSQSLGGGEVHRVVAAQFVQLYMLIVKRISKNLQVYCERNAANPETDVFYNLLLNDLRKVFGHFYISEHWF